jgi:hypothetical protein
MYALRVRRGLLVAVVLVLVELPLRSVGVRRCPPAWLLGWLPACARSELLTAAPITDCARFGLAPMGSHRVRLVNLGIVRHRVDGGADRNACSSP